LNALDDGSIILVSTEHPDEKKYPPKENCVRMKLPVAGVWVKPDPKRPGKSIIHQIIEANAMTQIPDFIMKIFISRTSRGLVTLRKLIPEYARKTIMIKDKPVIC
jgi:hypothetical protein